jgi:hypothetical protein
MPNLALGALGSARIVDLAINKNSFQEMSEAQVTAYAEVLAATVRGWLYSYNASRQFMNAQLQTPVHKILERYFAGGPTDEDYRRAGVIFEGDDSKRIFVGASKSGPMPARRARSDVIWLAEKAVRVA